MQKSLRELVAEIGKEVFVRVEGWDIRMRVIDVKVAYGKSMYLVKPLAGYGEVWVTTERIKEYGTAHKEEANGGNTAQEC